ncbi:MAG: DnaJ C-terminal domain-containing protein [Candidatus Latescibacteria bacterium]|jgi:curved DNA-binding protein|nr:DnaJ C-terminal domain-containing protein [Candidatus Latescibacterota bacterium]
MEFKDYYQILGVPRNASRDEIQKAYRKLAREYHPDVNKEAGAEARFKEIGEAHDVLKDPDKRAKYDRYGAAWKAAEQGGQAPPGFENIRFDFGMGGMRGFAGAQGGESGSFFDILEHLFGGSAMGRGPRGGPQPGFGGVGGGYGMPAQGADQEARIGLSLEEAAEGGKRKMTLTDPDTGQSKTLMVSIPRGVLPGQRIRLSGQGGSGGPTGRPGDLYLVTDVRPHPDFRLEDRDLHCTLRITPWEAALGATVTMKALDSSVRLRVPAGSSSGRRIRLKGKGFPGKDDPGDLYAEVQIAVPEELSEAEREAYEMLAEVSASPPR